MADTGCSSEGMEPFALRVIGDSMAPEFEDGHIIVVDPGFPLLDGVFAVIQNGDEILFGQYVNKDQQGWIRYLDPALEPVLLKSGFKVKGVVTQRNSRRRKDMRRYQYEHLLAQPNSPA